MDCKCNKQKRSYFFNVTEVEEGKIKEVMNLNFGGHHDLAAMVERTMQSGIVAKDKHAKELVIGMRFLHHVLKKYPDSELFQSFAPAFEEFKKNIKAQVFEK